MTTERRQEVQLPFKVGRAIGSLGGLGFVARRRTVDSGRDVRAAQAQRVVAGRAGRLRHEAGPVQGGKEPITRTVAREHPPGPVGAVGSGREADDEQGGAGSPNPGTARPQ